MSEVDVLPLEIQDFPSTLPGCESQAKKAPREQMPFSSG